MAGFVAVIIGCIVVSSSTSAASSSTTAGAASTAAAADGSNHGAGMNSLGPQIETRNGNIHVVAPGGDVFMHTTDGSVQWSDLVQYIG